MRQHWAWLTLALGLSACASSGKVVVRKGAPPVAVIEAVAAAPLAVTQTVSVARGDSLWRIARRQLGSGAAWPALAEANGLKDPWVLQPGQALQVPAGVTVAAKPLRLGSTAVKEATRYRWKNVRNTAYTTGEKLVFAVQYGAVTAGYATLQIPEVVAKEGRPSYHIVAEAQTHPFFETFFKVRDRIESFIDVDYGFSWGYEKHIREGGFSADAVYVYDQRVGLMREPAKGKEAPLPPSSQDVLSCFYWFRNLPLEVGREYTIPVTADDSKSYELKVNVLKKERISTLAGDFDCILVQPHLQFKGVFQQRGEVLLWMTDDARRIPVLIRSKIVIGSININLKDAVWVEPAN